MKVNDILTKKSSEVFTIRPHRSLREASQLLASKNIGALVVVDEDDVPIGIISERDLVRQLANAFEAFESLTVADVMTKEIIIALPDDDIDYLSSTMTNRRIRHLPVMKDDRLAGIVSIGDVVKAQVDYYEGEARTLRQYITGGYG